MTKSQLFESFLFKEWVPKIEKYRQDLEASIPADLKIELPKPIDQLIDEQFNAVKYLYDAKLLTSEELAITDSSAVDLVNKIAKGKLSSVEVFKAFAKRAVIAHQFTNCATEFFTEEGLKRAQELDAYLKENGKTVGPLHGLPVSLKEHLCYKGKVTHAGYVSGLDYVATEDSVTTQILAKLGAVFYVRTNQPQTLMHLDSGNNITGFCKNPYNLLLSSGGSSSGEGALTAFGGSTMGVGTDIGGSIRSPAAFSGGIGLRPSSNRISWLGSLSCFAGQESVPGVMGPLARSVDDIELFMESYINEGKPWEYDACILPMAWRKLEKPNPSDLTLAVIRDDGLVRVTPPVRRALNATVEKLKAAGVKIVEFNPPNTKLAYETVHQMYTCDGNHMHRKFLSASGEPLVKLTKWNLNYGQGARDIPASENRQLNYIRDGLRQEYTEFLVKNRIDFILSPTNQNVAPHSGEIFNWSYTSLFNILDFPTLVFQTGIFQDPTIDKWTEEDLSYKYRSPLEQMENENYNPEEFVGAPVGLQLSGRRHLDELVVAAGKTIVDVLGVDLFKH
ncbi:uncharacterized protein SPAPADRAFT_70583 [Spathaspora passalidarum NRRL Y-27907]|uniref:amidase n=1 Tax=Spathaspora passalidarum (strain NRRL Y-27907 / 11-Y1) TaxID=619300 RepID=G3AIQ9_SPAPN|nr:uncharacterized protein SPAPADRAFT_70583 [Spathaspora passalidarum NRRL Y-27907]EGW34475.1 hypothetical protein SPAPADRAFT_70583 [Spathaspora passalidarum NRRL Y-27907]